MAHAALRMRAELHDRDALITRFRSVREQTLRLTAHLSPEDMTVQSMTDASPVKWHLAHTSWFFEEFALRRFSSEFVEYDARFRRLFNSYYDQIGTYWPRPNRGLLSRPSVQEAFDYRARVEALVESLALRASDDTWLELAPILELGLNHEQQHQELICTDIKHAFGLNPLAPAAFPREPNSAATTPSMGWVAFDGGQNRIGAPPGSGFCYDNETPQHLCYVAAFQLADRPVTNGEYLDFMEDGGYAAVALWLSDGWRIKTAESWSSPAYWRHADGEWLCYTLHGLEALDLAAPVTHISFYEAAAFAEWAGARLPTEFEWEVAARDCPPDGRFAGPGRRIQPVAARAAEGLRQMFGDVWEWTRSPYGPYPGYRPIDGVIGEYNGKFMCNQMVLRGGSCATPEGHMRVSYRNYFPPEARWQFSGVRLAKDV